MLNLFGNPVALLPHYRATILEDLKMLRVFDNEKVISTDDKPGPPRPVKVKESMVKDAMKGSYLPADTMRGSDLPEFSHKSLISV